MDKSKVLYDKLYSDKLYTKSFDEFKNQFGTPEGQSKLFDKLSQEQLYTKSREEFTNQFFTPIQKKNPNQPTRPSSMVSPSPTKVQGTPLVSPSKSEEVGYLEDLWNRFRGSGAKALSSLMSIPSLAQNAAFDIIASATGKDEEFNKLPVSVKKDIRDLVKKSQSSTPVGKMSIGTEQAADYLNKKADKIYEKTIKQEGDVFTDINNFRKKPTAEGAGQVLSRALRSGVESLPYMGMMVLPGGLTTLGVSSAAQKRQEDISETGNIGIGNLLTAGAHGTAEAFFERYTQGILNRAGKLVAGNPVASKELASGIIKSIAKDFNVEGISEAATTAIQETADKLNKGEDIEIKPLLRKVADSYLLGGATGGGITAGAYGIKQFADKSVAGKNYILSKIMPADKKKELEKISNDRQALEFEKGVDTNPEVKSVIDGKISDLESQYNNIISEANTLYDNMSDDQIKEIITIDNDLDDNYNKAKLIIDDTTMDQDAKDLLLGDLLKKQNELKQQRDAIQKQATSQVPVQPKAAVSGEVAEGEPKAKPEVTTEEGQIQEINKRRQEELNSIPPVKMLNFSDVPTEEEKAYASKEAEINAKYDAEIEALKPKAGGMVEMAEQPIANPLSNVENTTLALQNIAKKTPEKVEKIRGEDVVYHGTKEDFDEFDEHKIGSTDAGWYGKGFYFHSDRDRGGYGDVVKAAKIDLKNPIVLPVEKSGEYLYDIIGKEAGLDESFRNEGSQNIIREIGSDNFTKIAKKLGYDGVIVNYLQGTKEIVAFDKSSIKQSNPKTISEEYHKAKQEGTNPELVKSVEALIGPTEQVVTEQPIAETPTVEEEVKSPFTQVKQGPQAKQKAVDQIEKALKRGRQLNQAVQGGISALRKTIAYEEANDVVREAMEREIRKDYGLKEKKAPTVKKLFPIKETKELVNTMTALKDQIKLEAKAAKGGAVAVQNAAKDLIGTIKELGKIGKITPFQVSRLTKLFGKNLLSPKTFDAAVETATKIVENSQYAKRLEDAFKIRKKLKSIAKRETKFQADVIKTIKQFTKVDPSKVDNLGNYENLAMALLRATRPVSVDKTGEVIGREAALLSSIDKFSEKEIKKQEELLKNALLDRYDYLVEEGKISSEMSYKDILNYVNSVEDNPENEDSTKSDLVKEYTKQAFDDAVAEYEENIDNVDPEDRKLLDEFTSMDIEKLPLEKQIMAVDAMQNYLVNDITTNMQALLNPYKGATNAEANAKAGLKAQPIKVGLIGRLGAPGQYYSNIWGEYISKADSLLANAFRSSAKAIKFLKDSGFSGVVNGFVQGKKIANTFAKEYTDKYEKTKPNDQDFNTAYNTYERGIFAALYRSVLNGSESEVKAEFDRQKNLLSETIDALENSGDKKLIKKAELYKQVYDKIKDAENIEDVKKVIDPINQDAVQTMVDFWKKFYPEFRKIASEVYNILLDEDVNYTPEMYEKILQEVSDDLLSKGSFRIGFDFVNTEKAGNLLKNNKVKTLPKSNGEVSRVRDYDFDLGNINALERTLVDIYTTPSVQQYLGYIGSDAFKQIFPDAGQRNLIKQRLNFNIDALRGKQNTYSPPAIKAFSNLVASLSKYGTRIGLGSFSSIFKQSLPMAANTVVNMGKDTPQFAAALQDYLANKDALDFLNKSGYGISLRGAEAQTSIDYAEKMIDKADLNKIESIANALSKTGDFYIENFLKKPDVAIANISWLAYYRKKLKDLGEDVDKINWETHKLNQEAADYAEFMVQDQQNMNVAELGGKLLASKNPAVKVARQLLFPFASYQFNLKDKNNRAMTILTSKNSNFDEKKEAMKSLSSGIVESIMFDAISAVVSSGLMSLAYASIGDEGEKEEKLKSLNEKLSWDFLKKLSATKILTEFVVPVAPQVDKITVDVANYLLDLVNPEDPKGKSKYKPKSAIGKQIKAKEEKMDDPFRFYSKESNFLDLVGGVPAIGAESLGQIWNDSKDAFTGEHTDKYGNVIKYNDEQKQLIMLSVLPKLLSSANLLPREALTYGKDLRKIIDEEAKRSPQNTKRKKKKFKGF